MDQDSASANKSTISQSVEVRPCELRLERSVADSDGRERTAFICGAAEGPEHGYVLGVAGEDLSSMIVICNACPIPNALASSRACLNLLPVRRFPGGKQSLPMLQRQNQAVDSKESADVYFPCRWFYTLYGQKQPRDLAVCRSCTHWFPRPPRELIPQYWPETEKMLRIVNGKESVGKAQQDLGLPLGVLPPGRGGSNSWRKYTCEEVEKRTSEWTMAYPHPFA